MPKELDKKIVSDFKKELRDLLKKYDADIWVALEGDTHGVSYELIVDMSNQSVIKTFGEGLSYHDLD